MSLYGLDTDHLSLYRYGHPEVSAHLEATPADQLQDWSQLENAELR